MMRKVLTLLTAILLVALLCTPMAARKEADVVLIHDADSRFGSFSVDKNDMTEGDASLSIKLSGDSLVADCKLGYEVDLSDCDTVAIDLYISDLDKIAGMNNIFFEISSSGTCDAEELQWEFMGQLRDDAFEEGWNTVYLDMGTASILGEFDKSAVNYLRFYTFYTKDAAGMTLKLDNIRGCYTGGEDFSDMDLDAYQGDNPDAEVIISGQSAPDLTKRDEGITKTAGFKK
jgi:hypothetical protein